MGGALKNMLVLSMVAVAVICSACFYALKNEHTPVSETDKLATGLAGLKEILPDGARIDFACSNNNATLYATCRYLLAPAYISFIDGEQYDTALIITNATDSNINTNNRRVIWQHTDSAYHYYLTCSD